MPSRAFCLLLALWMGLLSLPLAGAPPDLLREGASAVKRFTDEHGLPANSVDGLALDPQGRLWAATQGGPAVFDGHSWRAIPIPSRATTEWIHSLAFDPDGTGHLCSPFSGVYRWDGHRLTQLPAQGLQGRQAIQVLRVAGRLHVVTYQGLMRFMGDHWEEAFGTPWTHGLLNAAAVQGNGADQRLWTATATQGVGCLERGTWRWYGLKEGLPDLQVRALAVDGPRLWVGTMQGVACIENGQVRAFPPDQGLPSPAVRALALSHTPQGHAVLWIATEGGLARWEGPDRRTWNRSQGLPATSLSDLAVRTDPGGREIVWAATQGGVVQITGGTWLSFGHHLRVEDANTWAILETDRPRALWFASTCLNRWQDGRWSVFGPREGVPQDVCCALAATDGGRTVWLGTRGHGLFRFNGTRFEPVSGLPDPYAYSLLVTRSPAGREQLWVGTRKGASCLEAGRWRHMGTDTGYPEGLTTGLAAFTGADGATTLWASVRARGLGCLPPGADRWIWFGPDQSHLRPTSLRVVRVQGRDEVWMGTFGGGIRRFGARLPFTDLGTLGSGDLGGAPVDITFSVQQDFAGDLYAFTQRGVVRLKPTGSSFHPRHFSHEDGLPSAECQHQSSFVDREGRVWAGTLGGPAVVHPADLPEDKGLPPLQLLSVRVDGREAPREGASVALPISWRTLRLQVEFSQVAYHRSAESRYQTFLAGVDRSPTEWTPLGRREFSQLPPGRHRLEIRARDYAGLVSPPVALELSVAAPPWLSPWAFLVYGAALVLSGWGLLRWRLAHLRAQNQLLADQVAVATGRLEARALELAEANRQLEHVNQHLAGLNEEKNRMLGIAAHDLRNPLGTVDLYAQALAEEPLEPEAADMVGRIRTVLHHLATLVQQILDTSRIDAGNLDLDPVALDPREILDQLLPAHQTRAAAKGQQVVVEAPEDLPRLLADPLRLRQVLDNLVGNALKFMPPGPPLRTVTIQLAPGMLVVRDEGPGFKAEDLDKVFGHFTRLSARPTGGEPSTGLGLSIVRDLVEAMGGSIHLTSAPGEGACFMVQLPLAAKT